MFIDCNVNYKLPELILVGGETQDLLITIIREDGIIIDAAKTTSELSVSHYNMVNTSPLFTIKGSFFAEGADNLVSFRIEPKQTVQLSGQFLYQISLITEDKEVESYQGLLTILNNISKEFVTVTQI